jgi:hypothetical protein
MRAVWSFWTKPFNAYYSSMWPSKMHHLFAWVLSVEAARIHYPDTQLITDDEGARLLVDRLGLPFSRVSTMLNDLRDHDSNWWVLGKLYAYRCQTEPFVHIDNDVFLWKRLPVRLETSPLLAQNPEYCVPGTSNYRPEELEDALAQNGWLPDEWRWYRSQPRLLRAVCCGIFGGNAVDFIKYYASLAIQILECRQNQGALQRLKTPRNHCVLIEQFLLNACVEYHQYMGLTPYNTINISHLFADFEDAFDPNRAREMGYTHLLAGSKCDPVIAERLEARVRKDFAAYYSRIKTTDLLAI